MNNKVGFRDSDHAQMVLQGLSRGIMRTMTMMSAFLTAIFSSYSLKFSEIRRVSYACRGGHCEEN